MRLHNGHILGATAFLIAPVAVIVPLFLSTFLIMAACGAGYVRYVRDRSRHAPPLPLVGLVAALVAICAASLIWGLDPKSAAGKLAIVIVLMVAGLVVVDASLALSVEERRKLCQFLIGGFALGLAILVLERLGGAPIRHSQHSGWNNWHEIMLTFNRGSTVLAIAVWPAMLALERLCRPCGLILWIISGAVVASLLSGAAKLALVLGLCAFAASYALPRIAPRALASAVAVLVLTAPLLPRLLPPAPELKSYADMVSRSGYHRLLIWSFTAEKIAERPAFGWGFDSSRRIAGGEAKLDEYEAALPLHPHNAALQVWLELGASGGIIAAVLLGWVVLRLERIERRLERAVAAGAIIAALTIAFLSYGIWQSWWLGALWLGAGTTIAVAHGPRR